MLEQHPYIEKHFDSSRCWKYLIIGTFPPNKEIRHSRNSFVDYFYGNKGSLWKIIQKIYPEFEFTGVEKAYRIDVIKKWQEKYDVGITDTINKCTRRDINSADDADLIIDCDGYNHGLRDYLLKNINGIEKVLFTSSVGCYSAFETFKIIMADQMAALPKDKLITDLPSPSGSSNTAMFNVNTDNTLGLHPELYRFITSEKAEYISFFKNRWELKKKKRDSKLKVKLPSAPAGLVSEFKLWSYKRMLPAAKNN